MAALPRFSGRLVGWVVAELAEPGEQVAVEVAGGEGLDGRPTLGIGCAAPCRIDPRPTLRRREVRKEQLPHLIEVGRAAALALAHGRTLSAPLPNSKRCSPSLSPTIVQVDSAGGVNSAADSADEVADVPSP